MDNVSVSQCTYIRTYIHTYIMYSSFLAGMINGSHQLMHAVGRVASSPGLSQIFKVVKLGMDLGTRL